MNEQIVCVSASASQPTSVGQTFVLCSALSLSVFVML